MFRLTLLLATGTLAFAQQYIINTVAGGAAPPTPAPAAGVSIGQPVRTAGDSAGNVYFSGGHSVFRVDSAGTLTLVAGNGRAGFSGDGGPAVNAQLNSPAGIAVDRAGNIYIADSKNNRVRVVSAAGIIRTFAGTGNISPGGPRTYNDGGPATQGLLHLPMGLAVDASGNVFIADTGDNIIRKVDTEGLITTVAGDSFPSYAGDGGNAVDAELNKPHDVAVDSSGSLYIADTSNAAIRKVTTDGKIDRIAGNLSVGHSGDGGAATQAGLITPTAVALDGSGNLYIVQLGDSRIRKMDSSGVITTVAGTGAAGFGGDGGAATAAQLNHPTGIAVGSSGDLYVADSLNFRIRRIASGTISTFAGSGVFSYAGESGAAAAALFNAPQGVALDSAGNIYIADTANHVVRKIAPNGTISHFAGNRAPGFGGDNGAATSAQLNFPMGLAADIAGNVYIADSGNHRVRRVTPAGAISTVAGNGTGGFGGDTGAATGANLDTPAGVAVDSSGNLYIADLANNRVRRVTPGGVISTVAGTDGGGYSGDGGSATEARLSLPKSVAVDAAGNLFIADTSNNVVRQVTPGGQISTVAGTRTGGSFSDVGIATSVQIGNPTGIAVDSAGNIYISDAASQVRKVIGGLIMNIAGNGTAGYSGDAGGAAFAQLRGPSALAVAANGNVYVADTGNSAVRVLLPQGTLLQVTAVTNAASNGTGPIAPGEVVVLYGSGLGPAQLTEARLTGAGALPTFVAGTTVYFNNTPAPLLYTSANQVGAIVPFGLRGSTARIAVQYQTQVSAPLSTPVTALSPALFTLNTSGTGQALAFNVRDGALNDAAHPAPANSYVTLYATGTGETNPPGVDGRPVTGESPSVVRVTATIGGLPATVQYAGGAPGIVAGVTQINVLVPPGLPAGPAPVVINMAGLSSQAGVTIHVN